MPDERPKRKLMDPGRAVLWDAHCGEPIGWRKLGEPIIAEEWSPEGSVILTDMLTPARAVELYGPVTAITIGPGGGWRSVTYGETTFTSRRLDPRGSPYTSGVHVVVDDPDRQWPCPKCGASPGEPCRGPRSGKHQERRQWTLYKASDAKLRVLNVNPAAQVGTKPAPPCRAIRVPYRKVNVGIERTTTVTIAPPMSWSCPVRPA